MAFDEIRLDADICREAFGGPMFNTVVTVSGNAREQRFTRWDTERRRWTVQYVCKATDTKFKALLAFFLARRGRGRGFRFKDWSDYEDGGHGVIVSVGGQTRLAKTYDGGASQIVTRLITKPVSGTMAWNGGGSLNYTTGILTGNSGGTTWTGQFDVPVRFDTDHMEYKLSPDLIVIWDGIPVIELSPND